jgi:predicted small lipoprotein YifL
VTEIRHARPSQLFLLTIHAERLNPAARGSGNFPSRKGILGSPHIMKKFAAIAVAASMFALAACGEKAAEEATTEAPAAEAVAEEGADAAAAGAEAAAEGAEAAAAGAEAAAAPADAAAAPADAAAAPAEEAK